LIGTLPVRAVQPVERSDFSSAALTVSQRFQATGSIQLAHLVPDAAAQLPDDARAACGGSDINGLLNVTL
jgi:hypothetical protein